ncbi:MAG: hypothetical protein WBV31_11690 [Terriglobales bacterium]|jgi:hypothetical protein
MKKCRLFQLFACLAIVAFACSQLALAEGKPRFQIKVVPRHQGIDAQLPPAGAPPANLYAVGQWFGATAYPTVNTDGSDLWPCFGDSSSTGPNTDCPTIGNPSIPFPTGGVVVGSPSYTFSLSACDGNTATAANCGQTQTWYEDDSGDSTDDLLYSIVATQGTKTIADSGTVDFGPNVYGGLSPAADVIIYGDQTFGTLGVSAGPNNGECTANYNYPTTSDPAGGLFIIAANKTCSNPVAGLVTITATTEVATPKYTLNKKTGTYTVTYTKKYSVSQKWNIWLE